MFGPRKADGRETIAAASRSRAAHAAKEDFFEELTSRNYSRADVFCHGRQLLSLSLWLC